VFSFWHLGWSISYLGGESMSMQSHHCGKVINGACLFNSDCYCMISGLVTRASEQAPNLRTHDLAKLLLALHCRVDPITAVVCGGITAVQDAKLR